MAYTIGKYDTSLWTFNFTPTTWLSDSWCWRLGVRVAPQICRFICPADWHDGLTDGSLSPLLLSPASHSICTFPLRRSGDRWAGVGPNLHSSGFAHCVANLYAQHQRNSGQPSLSLFLPSIALECFVLPLAISAFSLSDRIQGSTKGISKLVNERYSDACSFLAIS